MDARELSAINIGADVEKLEKALESFLKKVFHSNSIKFYFLSFSSCKICIRCQKISQI